MPVSVAGRPELPALAEDIDAESSEKSWRWRVFSIGGALGLGSAANVFVGMVEAPLLVTPGLAPPAVDRPVMLTDSQGVVFRRAA